MEFLETFEGILSKTYQNRNQNFEESLKNFFLMKRILGKLKNFM